MLVRSAVCVDIDNVVAQTDERIREIIRNVTDNRVAYRYDDIINFNYFDCDDASGNRISREEWHAAHECFSTSEVLLSLKPINGALRNIQMLACKAEIHFVTSRLPSTMTATAEWLRQNGLADNPLHYCEHRAKHLLAKKYAAVVEDDYDQAVAFAQLGVPSFLIAHPWNWNRERVPLLYWHNQWDAVGHELLKLVS